MAGMLISDKFRLCAATLVALLFTSAHCTAAQATLIEEETALIEETALSEETALTEMRALRASELPNTEKSSHQSQIFSSQHVDSDLNWKLKKDRNGIQVFFSDVARSKFRAVLTVMRVQSSAKSLAALVMDFDNCSEWAAMCKQARVYRRVSDHEAYVYSLNNGPFPVRDRDVLAKMTWSRDKASGRISMSSQAVTDVAPKTKGVIRIESAISEWHFTPEGNNTVLVENYVHIDPNGVIPAWLSNIISLSAPYKTMTRMRRIVESGRYDDADLSFLPSD